MVLEGSAQISTLLSEKVAEPTQISWTNTLLVISITIFTLLWLWGNYLTLRDSRAKDTSVTDPPLLRRYSTYRAYRVPSTGFYYPSILTFYREHRQVNAFTSKPGPLPLIVFIHGLGGCAAQFDPLLGSLINVGSCLSVDLPGCGKSAFSPTTWDAYTTQSLVQLLAVIIESHRDVENGQGVIFIGHSMGCSLAALLASTTSKNVGVIPQHTIGVIAICPRAEPLSTKQELATRKLLRIPTFLFNAIRMWDRRGGPLSHSVHRMVGVGADLETKKMQLRFNEQSKTSVWRRMTHGLLPGDASSEPHGLPGRTTWEGLDMPVFLIAGESDRVAPPAEVEAIAAFLQIESLSSSPPRSRPTTPNAMAWQTTTLKPTRALKITILPHPAAHAIPYSPATTRTLSGLIQSFLVSHVDLRLSLGWQLSYLSSNTDKWEVKNLEKWQSHPPTSSEPVDGLFLPMKTMREIDDVHCPKTFVQNWGSKVKAVVDISHETPVYHPGGLTDGGVQYHKYPSISKLPPSDSEIEGFEALIDRLRAEPAIGSRSADGANESQTKGLIAVHCHYGFNRTGFFIVCYLVDRLGWEVQAAIDEFQRVRPPGIRHDYFLDTLFARIRAGVRTTPVNVRHD